jgi:hypothetical protein
MQEAVAGNPAYVGIRAPVSLEHRYLLEDVPTGLIPLIQLGEAAGLAVPMLRGLVDRAGAVLGGEAWQRPRTLDVLGLDGLDPAAIRTFVERGLTPTHQAVENVRSTSREFCRRRLCVPGRRRAASGNLPRIRL